MLHISKKAVAIVSAAALTLGLAACGSESSSDEGVGTADKPVTLEFWGWNPSEQHWAKIYAAWQKENPNIKINFQQQTQQADYLKKLQAGFAGGDGPDVFGLQSGALITQYSKFSDDMEKLADKYMSGWKDDVSSGAIDQMKDKDGKIVAMPTISSGQEYLLYNKTFLDELGMKVPTTYDELKQEAQELRAKGLAPVALGAKESWHLDDLFVWMSNQFGEGDIYKVEEGKGKFTDPTFVKTMKMWKQMVDDGVFQDGAVGTATYPDARDNYFYARKTPFFPTGSWHVSATISDDETKGTAVEGDELGMVQFPSLTDKPAKPTTGVDFALAVNKDSKRKEAAMKFIQFMTTGEGQRIWTNTLQGSPVSKKTKIELPSTATQSAKDSVALITKGQAESKLVRKLNYPELDNEIAVQMQNIYTGSTTVDEALKAIQTVNESIDRD